MNPTDQDLDFMKIAIDQARLAFDEGEVPVGAALVVDGELIVTARNNRETSFDPTGHAETMVIREGARKLGRWRLSDATLYVTKEPCPMCAGAMLNARLGRLVYGCDDTKGGAVTNLYQLLSDNRLNHQVKITSGVMEEECAGLLKTFFQDRRKNNCD
jgi:tRNA(adenine34) deaminase